MNIDKEKVKKAFRDYVNEFDVEDEMIHLKKLHTINVASICEDIGKSLSLSDEEIDLCFLVGMLHDIARFRQHTIYKTFYDYKSFDHAKMGCEILFDEGLINRFVDEEDQDKDDIHLLRLAIRWHSAYRLPKNLNEKEKLFCNIIRDADKVDIFRVAIEEPVNNVYSVSRKEELDSEITPEVLEAFYEHHAIKRELIKTMADVKVGFVALSFELVFPRSKEIAKEQGFLVRIIEDDYTNENTIRQVEGIKNELNNYLNH